MLWSSTVSACRLPPSHLQILTELAACGLGADRVDALWEAYQAAREEEEALNQQQQQQQQAGGGLGGKENQVSGAGKLVGPSPAACGAAAAAAASSSRGQRPPPPAVADPAPAPAPAAAAAIRCCCCCCCAQVRPAAATAIRVGAMALGVVSRLIQVVRMLHQVGGRWGGGGWGVGRRDGARCVLVG